MKKTTLTLFSISLMLLLAHPASASIIFFDDFDGTGNLHDTTPDTTTGGAKWVAAGSFDANGSHSGRGSATLAFTPVDGFVYTAETWISASSGDFWVGMGFGNGQSTGNGVNDVHSSAPPPEGRAWMILRMPNVAGTVANDTFLTNTQNGGDWTSFGATRGAIGMRIDLDTTGGAGNWNATFYAKENELDPWTQVRAATTLTDEDITSIGFSAFRSVDNFTTGSFTVNQVPEPSSFVLMLVALLGGMLVYRRRR